MINEVVNKDSEGIEIKVNAKFIEGSFGFEIEILQGLVNAIDIVEVLGLTGAAGGVFGVLDWLKGKKIDKISNEDGVAKIINKDHEEFECSPEVAKLVANSTVRNNINNLVRKQLQYEGTDTFKILSKATSKKPSLEITRDTSANYTSLKAVSINEEDTKEKRVKFVAADIKKKTGWKIEVDGNEISARMEDDGFRERLQNMNEVNIFGKTINVQLKTILKTKAGVVEPAKYEIEHVHIGSER